MAKFKIKISVHYSPTLEIPDEDLEGLSEEERDEYIFDAAHELSQEYIDISYTRIEDGKA